MDELLDNRHQERLIKIALQRKAKEVGNTERAMMEAFLMGVKMGENKALKSKKKLKNKILYLLFLIIGFLSFFFLIYDYVVSYM